MADIEEAAKSLNKAMKGIGTDEKRLVKEIVSYENDVRQLIKKQYMTLFGKELEEDIKSECSGKFLQGILNLLEQVDDYEARCLRKAISGVGTNEKIVIEMIFPKEAHEIERLKDAYNKLFDRDLCKDMTKEEGGALGRMFRSIVGGGRAENDGVDDELAHNEAQELYDAGEGTFGTDESKFVQILCSRSFEQLHALSAAYEQISGDTLEKAIKKEMSGDLEKACLAIVKCASNKPAYFAEKIHDSLKGMGTDDEDLMRILAIRSDYDLPEIKKEYERMYGKSLYDAVKSDLSGDYEKLFLGIIGKDD